VAYGTGLEIGLTRVPQPQDRQGFSAETIGLQANSQLFLFVSISIDLAQFERVVETFWRPRRRLKRAV